MIPSHYSHTFAKASCRDPKLSLTNLWCGVTMGGPSEGNPQSPVNPVAIVLAATFLMSVSFQILLPVGPILMEASGPHGVAGAGTAVLFGATVAGELVAPFLMSQWSPSRLLFGSLLLLALPSVVFGLSHPELGALLVATLVRGFGTGLAIVLGVALLTELAQPGRLGRAIGYFGLATGIPGIISPSIGLFLVAAHRRDLAAAVALVSALAACSLAVGIRGRARAGGSRTSLVGAVLRPGLLALFVGYVLASCTFGGILTFVSVALPAAGPGSSALFFLVAGSSRAISRWLSGALGDQLPARQIVAVGVVLAGIGTVLLTERGSPQAVLLAAASYGLGYGGVQTGVYLAMNERSAAGQWGAVSFLWNSAIDIGNALGGAAIGLSANLVGYTTAIWLMPAVLLASAPLLLKRNQGAQTESAGGNTHPADGLP